MSERLICVVRKLVGVPGVQAGQGALRVCRVHISCVHTPHPVVSYVHTTVGNTRIVKLRELVSSLDADVFVKLEYFSPTGSYKDRMALSMIEEAERRGTLCEGMTVVEYTGGSTGSSLAFVCAAKGYNFHVVSSDAFAAEKLDTMRAFGATLEIVHSPTGKSTPGLVPAMMARAREMCRRMAREEGIFAGTSSGLNVVAALQLARELGVGHRVVTVACDSGLKYLSGSLYHASESH